MKRLVDVIVSTMSILILLPVLLVLAAAVFLEDKGPPLYRQVRVGRGGAEFRMLKFRSMVVNADRLGGYSTEPGDRRITRVGAFIRRTSLDELPQLFNVLLGDMSLVGPRPDVPAQRALYTDEEWRRRHIVRPGITGLTQATLRSDATLEQRKALDLEYVARASLLLDAKIIALTVRQVLTRGSH